MSKKIKNKLPNYDTQICVFNTFFFMGESCKFMVAWVQKQQIVCLDTQNAQCEIGADFMRADQEGTFPIKVYETIKHSK